MHSKINKINIILPSGTIWNRWRTVWRVFLTPHPVPPRLGEPTKGSHILEKSLKSIKKKGLIHPWALLVILVTEIPSVFPERLVFRTPLRSSHTFFEHENGKMNQTTGQKNQIVALPPGRLAEWPRTCHFSSMGLKFAHLIHGDSLH